MTEKYQPPFAITPGIVTLVAEISEKLGRLSVRQETPALLISSQQCFRQQEGGNICGIQTVLSVH